MNKNNKEIRDERLLKIGLGVGKGDMSLEGSFQLGWVRKPNKKYTTPKANIEKTNEIIMDDDADGST